ncbi:MAG: ADOP family duplicated permease [Longimicrobiales bacterium]
MSGLPPRLQHLIDEVVEATGLELPDRHDVARELAAHFEDGLAAGRSEEELVQRFGDPTEAAREIARARRRRADGTGTHDGRWWMSVGEWWQQARQSVRALARAPGFSALVVLTLALGVGANTAVFTVLDAVLLAPLPYAEPDRLVRMYEADREDPSSLNFVRGPVMAAARGWTEVFDSAASIYTYRETGADLTDGEQPRRINVLRVSAGYFETLGIPPMMGRTFRENETTGPGEATGRDPLTRVVILGHGLWRDQFGEDPDIVGRTVRMDGESWEVVGVMPAGFEEPFGPPADAWIPQDLRAGDYNSWGNFYLSSVARLRDGVTLEAAQARIDALYAGLAESVGEGDSRWRPRIVPLHDDVVGDTRRAMLLLLAGAAGLVLLSACVNVANLVFARGLGRARDAALRSALGSGRLRLMAGTLVESAVLATAGGVLGVLLGWFGVRTLLAVAPDALPLVTTPELSLRVFGFAMGVSALALLVFGLAPALRTASVAPGDALRHGERGSTGGGRLRAVRDGLVVVQVAAGLVLLTGAGLLTRSFLSLQDVALGVESEGVLSFEVHLPAARYPQGIDRHRFHDVFQRRVAELPGVEAAGAVSWLPVNGRYHSWGVAWAPGGAELNDDNARWENSDIRVIHGDYFAALGVDVRSGAEPQALDPDGEPVVWVNETFARQVFDGEQPVGQRVWAGNGVRTVAGVVEDIPFDTRGATSRKLYIPHAQFADNRNWALIQTVAVRGDMAAVREEIRGVLASMDAQLVLYKPTPFAAVLAGGRARDRFATLLMGAFATLALMLTLVGTYGVLAHAVAGRRREIGIRMALGADHQSVRGMVLRYATRLMIPGVAFGLLAAWYGSRWVEGLLFRIGTLDPVVYGATVTLVVAACLLAGWVPARRATRVDPARALAAE